MSLLCFLSQYPLSRSAREEMEHQAKKVSNFVDGANGLENDKKRRGIEKSGRPSSMSPSQKGSSVPCIAVHTGNWSTFLQWAVPEEKVHR